MTVYFDGSPGARSILQALQTLLPVAVPPTGHGDTGHPQGGGRSFKALATIQFQQSCGAPEDTRAELSFVR
ncbi:MAG: hypothetical protein JWR19_819 [Pedosphaera sp.]|nr:hypothetical protein [Pedosphaera sp.]